MYPLPRNQGECCEPTRATAFLQAVRCCWGFVVGDPFPLSPRAALRVEHGPVSDGERRCVRGVAPSPLPEAGLDVQLLCHPPNPRRGAATRACPQGPAAPWPRPGEEDKLIPR